MNYARFVLPLVWLLAPAVVGRPVLIVAQSATLTHRAGREVTFEVTSNGLSRITVQGRALAVSEWSVFNAESWQATDYGHHEAQIRLGAARPGGRPTLGMAASARSQITQCPQKIPVSFAQAATMISHENREDPDRTHADLPGHTRRRQSGFGR